MKKGRKLLIRYIKSEEEEIQIEMLARLEFIAILKSKGAQIRKNKDSYELV